MYATKHNGKNGCQTFNQDMAKKNLKNFTLGNGLRHALDRHEFTIYYQPQIELPSGRLYGFEALLRWNHPELGLISPADFIPLAEETGLIVPIGEWILRSACNQLKKWETVHPSRIMMSINLSVRQLKSPTIVDEIQSILTETGINPSLIKLELTESVLIEGAESAETKLLELAELGLEIAIDDFGTGYSSMAYLKKFPVNYLKIDQSFVRGIPTDAEDIAISKAIIALANSLNMINVAEGIETQAQLEFMLNNGCQIAQGYLISKPLPPEDIETKFIGHALVLV